MTTEEEAILVNAGLTAIGKIIEVVRSAQVGAVTPHEALASITAMHDSLLANDVTADKALRAKFHKDG